MLIQEHKAPQMDKTYAQRLHKTELVLRGFFLNALRLQIKPFKDFFVSHGYLPSPEDYISPQPFLRAYNDSYRYVVSNETKLKWDLLEKDFVANQKDYDPDLGYDLIFDEIRAYFLSVVSSYYSNVSGDLNRVSIERLKSFINKSRAAGMNDAQIAAAINTEFDGELRVRAGGIAATEATSIMQSVANKVAQEYYSQRGVTGYRTWLTREDERVRHTHVEVDKRTLPIDVKFVLNRKRGGIEFADYPGQETLSAENRVHCRCMLDYHSDALKYKRGT